MGTWLVSIKTSAGETVWSEENRELSDTVFDLWQRAEVLHLPPGGKVAFDARLSGKVRPVLNRMEEERDRHSHEATKKMLGTIAERLSSLDPEDDLAITLMGTTKRTLRPRSPGCSQLGCAGYRANTMTA